MSDTVRQIHARVATLRSAPHVLAVSGGADSMVLLDASASVLPRESFCVATFDHGTGAAASAAAELVAGRAAALGVTCLSGHAELTAATEAEWRAQRWAFLRSVACNFAARVATAHTRNDQLETVFIRALRGAGPRGLAGLCARSEVDRPLLSTSRDEVLSYARSKRLEFVTDPSNVDRRHLRNRVRLDILPALRSVSPAFEDDLLSIGQKAAHWRAQMEAIALSFPMMTLSPTVHAFPRVRFRAYPDASLRTLWPALAARVGVVLDWRGTERLAAFTIAGATGQKIQLAGRVEVTMERGALVFDTTARG